MISLISAANELEDNEAVDHLNGEKSAESGKMDENLVNQSESNVPKNSNEERKMRLKITQI